MKVEALERGGFGADNIIYDMDSNPYYGKNGIRIDESYIMNYSYGTYGKLGLTADGDSRLIIRAQTDKPGYANFSFKEDIGAPLESLNNRIELYPGSNKLTAEKWGDSFYQVSAVLVAPEMFPQKKNFRLTSSALT